MKTLEKSEYPTIADVEKEYEFTSYYDCVEWDQWIIFESEYEREVWENQKWVKQMKHIIKDKEDICHWIKYLQDIVLIIFLKYYIGQDRETVVKKMGKK